MVQRARPAIRNIYNHRKAETEPAPTGRTPAHAPRRSGTARSANPAADAASIEPSRRVLLKQSEAAVLLTVGCGFTYWAMPQLTWLPRFGIELVCYVFLVWALRCGGRLLLAFFNPPARASTPPSGAPPLVPVRRASNKPRSAAHPAARRLPPATPQPRAPEPWSALQAAYARGTLSEARACAWRVLALETVSPAQLKTMMSLPGLFNGERGFDLAPALARRCTNGLARELYLFVAEAASTGDLPLALGLWSCQEGLRHHPYRLSFYLTKANLERQAGRLGVAAEVLRGAPRWLRWLQDGAKIGLQRALLRTEGRLLARPAAPKDGLQVSWSELKRALNLGWRLCARPQDTVALVGLQGLCLRLGLPSPTGAGPLQLERWLQQLCVVNQVHSEAAAASSVRPPPQTASAFRPQLPQSGPASDLLGSALTSQVETILGTNWTGLPVSRSACGRRARWFHDPELLLQWKWRRLPPLRYVTPANIRIARPKEVAAMQAALERACSGRHNALHFMDALRHRRGPEAADEPCPPEYACVIGGMVRDVLWATSPERPTQVSAPLPKDADILHTRIPTDAMRLANALTGDVRGSAGERNGLATSWALLTMGHCAYDSGSASDAPGVDLVSTRANQGAYEPRQLVEGNIAEEVWPLAFGATDMGEDARLRCAYLNTVAYFPEERVFVDYTGEGIDDARHWRWRCGDAMLLRNRSYLSRFYKGVGTMGCSTDAQTRRDMGINAQHFYRQDPEIWAREVAKAARSGSSANESAAACLDRLEKFLKMQGMAEVTATCIKPVRQAVLAALQAQQ